MKKFFFAFKVYYLIYVLLAFNAFVNESAAMSLATNILAAAGCAAVVCIAVRFKRYKDVWNIWLIGAFLASYVLSSLLNYQYGITDNVKEIIWLFLFMVVLYASCRISTVEEMKKEFRILSIIWVVYCSIANLISISMVIWGRNYDLYSYRDGRPVGLKEIGFKWGRLWGVYDDPNHGAAIAVAAFILALYLFFVIKNKAVKVFLIAAVVIQFLYITLSDSRTGMVMLGTAGFFWAAIETYGRQKAKGKVFSRALLVSVVIGLVAAGALSGGTYICKQGYNSIDKKIEAMLPERPGKEPGKKPGKKPSGQVGREQDIADDTSNGRLAIWKSGLEIVKTSPVYGTSFRNMTEYARKNLPETYLVNNPEGSAYDSLHNSVMDVIVSQGLVGILLLAALILNILRLMKKKLVTVANEDRRFTSVCFVTAASMAAGSMFLSMVFYLNAPQTYIFWLCLGYFAEILRRGEERE